GEGSVRESGISDFGSGPAASLPKSEIRNQVPARISFMAASTLVPFEALKPGDRVAITQRIKVGLKIWTTKVTGTVERTERRREGLNVKRSFDDKAWADLIVLKKEGAVGEETTVTLDEWTHVERA